MIGMPLGAVLYSKSNTCTSVVLRGPDLAMAGGLASRVRDRAETSTFGAWLQRHMPDIPSFEQATAVVQADRIVRVPMPAAVFAV
jgi:hypothetical protein